MFRTKDLYSYIKHHLHDPLYNSSHDHEWDCVSQLINGCCYAIECEALTFHDSDPCNDSDNAGVMLIIVDPQCPSHYINSSNNPNCYVTQPSKREVDASLTRGGPYPTDLCYPQLITGKFADLVPQGTEITLKYDPFTAKHAQGAIKRIVLDRNSTAVKKVIPQSMSSASNKQKQRRSTVRSLLPVVQSLSPSNSSTLLPIDRPGTYQSSNPIVSVDTVKLRTELKKTGFAILRNALSVDSIKTAQSQVEQVLLVNQPLTLSGLTIEANSGR